MGNKYAEMNIESLYNWIDSHEISRQKKNINRDFSDAVPLAEILKKHFPKLVDLHNYAAMNSLSKKLNNWELLNRKVLTPLGMGLSPNTIQNLAEAAPGVIERVLFEIKEMVERREADEQQKDDVNYLEALSSEISGTVVHLRDKDGRGHVEHKIVPITEYVKFEKELEEKNEAIQTFRSKVQHLETLLALKENRIKDLETQIRNMGL